MKKLVPILIILGILGFGAYTYLTGGKVQVTPNGLSVSKTITSNSETFVGDLKAAVAKGTPFKCTFKTDDGMEGTGFMKNKQYYGDISMQGKPGGILMLGNCMWTWDKTTKQGAKMCFEGDIWEMDTQDQNTKMPGQYTCVSDATIADSLFQPPADVTFMDIDNMSGDE